ncbi:MAG: hypothetical protein QHJ73_18380, partial [Armatimonadota bacterium]|nr:hypothetical protein [Armatimonadota bacterium]
GSGYGSSVATQPGATSTSARAQVPAATGVVYGVVASPAPPRGVRRPLSWLPRVAVVSAAYAQTTLARQPLAGARVRLVDRATRQPVSPAVVANARGEYRIENVTPSNRFCVEATDGEATLSAVVPVTDVGRQEIEVPVHEATTIGAEAARLAEDEGLGPDAAVRLAQHVTERQEKLQAEKPAEVPDLTRPAEITARARAHLVAAADEFFAAALDTKDRVAASWAVAAVQVMARERLRLPSRVRLTPLQVEALANALVQKETRAVSAARVAAALAKAGVKGKEGRAVTPGDVAAALEPLRKPLPSLKDATAEALPVLGALLLAEQGGEVAFQITTREQMRGFLKELVGEATEAPVARKSAGAPPPADRPQAAPPVNQPD